MSGVSARTEEERGFFSETKQEVTYGNDYLPSYVDRHQQGLLFSRQMTLQQCPEMSGDGCILIYSQNQKKFWRSLVCFFYTR